VTDGKPHLRIENRVLPSGPTPADEVANAAFWLGLLVAAPCVYGDVRKLMAFDDAKTNFLVAARVGLQGQFTWFGGESVPAQDLICERLLPLARQGLQHAGIDSNDVETYLGIVDDRVRSGMTGSQWMVQSLLAMKNDGKRPEQLNAVTAGLLARQKSGKPVATWNLARIDEAGGIKKNYWKVEHYMTTDLFTVCEDEPIELVASIMDWQKIRHVPVEDMQSRLVGVVSYRTLLRLIASGWTPEGSRSLSVGEVMKRNPVSVSPDTPTTDAVELMRQHKVSALPVVKDGRLVGIVSERDFMQITSDLLAERLRQEAKDAEHAPETRAASGSG
jgi:CBS domain-containing protein